MLRCALVCLRECCKQGAKRCRFERWSDVALLEIATVHSNPISVDCHRFSPPFGARLVALSSSSLGLLIGTSLETGVAGIEEREAITVLESLRDCGPVVLLLFDSFGFELAVASAEWPWICLGSELELVAAPFCCVRSVEV
ncbi:protein ECERIFERUM 1-like [Dorcoceras hygrometricum]|uniref:Protein ECERIFERUM 1-like n=1 Tax=Dorcoceras hygrometricum TaxID=472368 RepID=A0A2Z7CZ90_9LAMI|nr:protein ECERIFERUM 1-like [Dorcoceras hygrometricum]